MSQQSEFPDLPAAVIREGDEPELPELKGKARLRSPNRAQVKWDERDLDSLIPLEHPARTVWSFVESLDLTDLVEEVQAFEGRAGRPAIDPALLLALWLYGLGDDVRCSRDLEELCRMHDAYRWLCGGVSVNYHTLSDFRTQSTIFDGLLTQMLAVLTKEGILQMQRVAQDGIRIRASAGASSFHTKDSMKSHLAAAEERVKRAKEGDSTGSEPISERQKKARERAATERAERVKRALELMPEAERAMEARPEKKRTGQPRTSTTDPEARVMKMADGGFRPAYNGQIGADTKTTIVVAVDGVNVGSDMAQLVPMLDQIEKRLGCFPDEMLADGGFPSATAIDGAAARGVRLTAPVPRPRGEGASKRDRYEPVPGDSKAKVEWRTWMATAEAQEIYRERGATIELVNARLRRFGLSRLTVRGLEKVRAMILLSVLTHNLFRADVLRRARVAA